MMEPPKSLTQRVKLKHIKIARIVGVFTMLIGLIGSFNFVFFVGLLLLIGSYQISIERWEVEWAKKESEETIE